MQEAIALPERGWSVNYRVENGYGINRCYDYDKHTNYTMVMLPSRSEINTFILEQGESYFTKDELGSFLTSDLMSGTYFDVALRKTPTPKIVSLISSTLTALEPADVIDSWLRASELWNNTAVGSSQFEYDAKEYFAYTLSTYEDDENVVLDYIAFEREDFIDELFPSHGELTISRYSRLLRTPQSETVLNILDSAGVTSSTLRSTLNSLGINDREFTNLVYHWNRDSVTMGRNLAILQGGEPTQESLSWFFAMAKYEIELEVVEHIIAKGGTCSNITELLDRGVPNNEVEKFVGHDIDPSLGAVLYDKVSA